MKLHRCLILLAAFCLLWVPTTAPAKSKARKRKHYPPVTHPVVLWSRTLSESSDPAQKKVAAFKLSQYTQTIYQEEVITTLKKCMKDPDIHIKIFCTKAMARAGNKSQNDSIRKHLLSQYKEDPQLRSTLIRTFIARKDGHSSIQDELIETAKESNDPDELIPLLNYFETNGTSQFFDSAIKIYQRSDNLKVKRAAVKALAERGQGQDSIISLLGQCTESKDTPLVLTCLSGLQLQGKKDSKTWSAVEKSIESSDPDVLMATMDVIQVLPENANTNISARLTDVISDTEDSEVLEKALLALGVCGDQNEKTVKAIQKVLEKSSAEEGNRITAALVLGKQGFKFSEKPTVALNECKKSGATQSLKTACQLGLQELENRKAPYIKNNPIASSTPSPLPSPSPTPEKSPLPTPEPKAD